MAARLPIQVRFGQHISRLRADAGLTQEEVALRCKVSRTYLSQLETGERNPSLSSLEKIAKAFKVSLSDLMQFD
ncbi:MAG: helix-turn-helix transcriptional regulator [Planctomycetota bacterium]